jgi:hypothetical protein
MQLRAEADAGGRNGRVSVEQHRAVRRRGDATLSVSSGFDRGGRTCHESLPSRGARH